MTALHTLNNTRAKGFNQMAPPAWRITVALDMSKAFDTINIQTLIRMLLQRNMPGRIIKFIANYIKWRETYTPYRNHTSIQRQFKTGVPQGGVISPTLFIIYTAGITTTQGTGSGHGLRRLHHHHIYIHKHECSKEIHTTIPTYIKFLPGKNITISY